MTATSVPFWLTSCFTFKAQRAEKAPKKVYKRHLKVTGSEKSFVNGVGAPLAAPR